MDVAVRVSSVHHYCSSYIRMDCCLAWEFIDIIMIWFGRLQSALRVELVDHDNSTVNTAITSVPFSHYNSAI